MMIKRILILCTTIVVASAQGFLAGQTPAAPGRGRGGAPTPASCGPNASADLKNVAADSRCFELRTYTLRPGGAGSMDLNHQRFREHFAPAFKRHDITVVGFWQPVSKPDTFIYLLAYKDAAARDTSRMAAAGSRRRPSLSSGRNSAASTRSCSTTARFPAGKTLIR